MNPSKILAIAIMFFMLVSSSWGDGGRYSFIKSKTSVAGTQVFGSEEIVDGTSILTRTSKGVGYTWNTRDLDGDRPHSNWWVVFNNPKKCSVPCRCTPMDLSNPAVKAGLFWATGRFTDKFGQANFSAYTKYGELPDGPDQTPISNPIKPGAEIHIAARKHGPTVDDGEAQRTQFNGGCPPNPVVPPEAGDGCQNVQISVHRSPYCRVYSRRW